MPGEERITMTNLCPFIKEACKAKSCIMWEGENSECIIKMFMVHQIIDVMQRIDMDEFELVGGNGCECECGDDVEVKKPKKKKK